MSGNLSQQELHEAADDETAGYPREDDGKLIGASDRMQPFRGKEWQGG